MKKVTRLSWITEDGVSTAILIIDGNRLKLEGSFKAVQECLALIGDNCEEVFYE